MKKVLLIGQYIVLGTVYLAMPCAVFAQVRFNEIAWMGIAGTNGQYGEWLELYNDGQSAVDTSGWKIAKAGGAKNIMTFPQSTIAANSFLVIKRTTASVPDPLPSVQGIAVSFANSGLSNSGEDLVLQDGQGNTVDHLLFSTGWPAGDATTKDTMQYKDGSWITASATANILNAQVQTQSQSQNQSQTQTQQSTDTSDTSTNTTGTTSSSTASSTSSTSNNQTNNDEAAAATTPTFVIKHIPAGITFSFPKTLYTGVPYPFMTKVAYDDMEKNQGYFVWNFGDGTSMASITNDIAPSHTYMYSGTYIISFAYYSRKGQATPLLRAQSIVTVQKPSLIVTKVVGGIQLQHTAQETIDISQWYIAGMQKKFIFPDMTVVAPSSVLTILCRDIQCVDGDTLYTSIGVSVGQIQSDGSQFANTKNKNINKNTNTSTSTKTAKKAKKATKKTSKKSTKQ